MIDESCIRDWDFRDPRKNIHTRLSDERMKVISYNFVTGSQKNL